ncbi:hypothetical protein COB55_01225 [Candidatus Wolfebacteria bacterium]|nr:MAG: hypothetical protein COB55_01225 [Candidatus Wolfebacteria bacterium]
METIKKYIRRVRKEFRPLCRDTRKFKPRMLVLAFVAGFFVWSILYTTYGPPNNFPVGDVVTIEEGMTLDEVTVHFENVGLVRSAIWMNVFVRVFGHEGGVVAGDYAFENGKSVMSIARRVSKGIYGLTPIRVLLPEGVTTFEIAEIMESKFPKFSGSAFLRLVKKKEGYLFPDTYFFLPNIKAEHVVEQMESNFWNQIATVQDEIDAFGKSVDDVVIMASLLEEEARKLRTRQMISGILWERIRIGMALQVDAVFPYIIGKNTYEVTLDDLKVDSPYNTYKYPGLPIGAISNPGLSSIRAAVSPIKSPYLFYLSDRQGGMHYARDFEEHKMNRRLYLN